MAKDDDELAQQMYDAAVVVLNKLHKSAAGDCYEYQGGMNAVEDLREALERWRYKDIEKDVPEKQG